MIRKGIGSIHLRLTSVMTGSSCLPAWKHFCTPESIRTERCSLEGVFVGLIQALRLRYTNVFDQGNGGRFMVEERASSCQISACKTNKCTYEQEYCKISVYNSLY